MHVERIAMTSTRSSTRLWVKRLQQTAWVGGCAVVVLASAQGIARAEDGEDSIWNLDTRIYRGFMSSLGLKSGTEESIEYRERSPLVVPPSRDLPSPAANTPPPAWPVDVDQKRRKDAAVAKRNRKDANIELDAAGTHLSPSELNRPGTRRADAKSGGPTNSGGDYEGNPVAPSALGYMGGLFTWSGFGFGAPKEEVGTFTREPSRGELTAPPVGYQTPSATSPYGVTKRIEPGKAVPHDPGN
jgi:hypothetical protein